MLDVVSAGYWHVAERWLFRALSFRVEPGAITAILGPNGRGKTTLLRAICGILPLREGTISEPMPIGYVPQTQQTPPGYSVLDMVLLGRSRYIGRFSTPCRADVARAHECLEDVGFATAATQRYDRLSGGERQLVLLARALATDCELLVRA